VKSNQFWSMKTSNGSKEQNKIGMQMETATRHSFMLGQTTGEELIKSEL
jgi:hypothetical protein